MIPASPLPDFRSPAFLRAHIEDTLSFYLPRAIDPSGGLHHFLRDDGRVYDGHTGTWVPAPDHLTRPDRNRRTR